MRASVLLVGALLFLPCRTVASSSALSTQNQSGAISGLVKDPTGAGVAGVTVEASSPALIEKARTVVTDTDGAYRIVGLRPGTYVLTFTMPTFTTIRLEGVEVTSSFTATLNAGLRRETTENTTVQIEDALLDTQNVSQQTVTSRLAMDTLPTDRTFIAFASMTPGMQVVGGCRTSAARTLKTRSCSRYTAAASTRAGSSWMACR